MADLFIALPSHMLTLGTLLGSSPILPRTTPPSPASTSEAKPGSATKEAVTPTYQASNASGIPLSKSTATPATAVSANVTEIVPTSSSSSLPRTDANSSSTQALSSTAAPPSLSPSTVTHAPPDDGDNSTTHTNISASSGTPANIPPALSETTLGPIATPVDCSRRTISVAHYEYNSEGVTAELAVTKKPELQNVSCGNAHCTWDKDRNTLAGLQECDEYKIVASFNGCDDLILPVHVPPETNKWKLEEPKKSNTSVTLSWNNRGYDKHRCHLRYYCRCHPRGKNFQPTKEQNGCTVTGLSPNKNYNCSSEIWYNGTYVKTDNKQLTTDYGTPGKPEDISWNSSNSTIEITWKKPQSEENGPIDGYMVCLGDHCSKKANVSKNTSYIWNDLKPYKNYSVYVWAYTKTQNDAVLEGQRSSKTIPTKAAKPTGVRNLKADLSNEANNAVKIKCSKPEQINGPKEEYILYLEDENKTKKDCSFEVKDLAYLTTYTFKVGFSNGNYTSEALASNPVTTRYNSQALIIFLAFLIIVTSVALLLVLYKIYTLNKKRSSDPDTDDEKHLLNIDPIPAELLWETYKRKIADEGRLFLDEFQSIPRVFSKFAIKDARKSYNQNKNRYIDILPYDYNRVELSSILGDPGSDYINASHIDGFTEPRKYIAAQGPKEETTDDFWRMIWEQKATIVVMVTRCEEGNRVKCAKYWPSIEEETASYGDIVVKINECKVCPDYNIQKLHITNRREKTTGRDVTHIQFTSWPDHGVPDNPHLLLKLRRRVNAFSNFFSGPVVVHCSAGVGRTGTYIAIDAMLEGLEAEGRMDVYGYIVKLRRQRCLMVQVESQYILIHQALVEYIQFGETEVNIPELHNCLNYLKKRDPASDPSPLEAEFQRLPSYRNWQTQRAANRDENKSKNRSSTVLPYDYNRVLFKCEEEGSQESEHDSNDEDSDEESECEEPNKYINASYITGYWLQNAMIATQGPLPETIGDFWNMVYQRKVKVIAMLTELKDDTQEFSAQYWGDEKRTYDGIAVELKDVNHCSSYTVRTFDVTHVKRKETRKVFQYQYHKWKTFVLPENPKSLVTMIQDLKQKLPPPDVIAEANMRSSNVPLVVHCCDGAQQTGVFCALLNLLESAETEGVIDVFQTVKSLRRARPAMISSFEDYQFLYDAIASVYPAQNGQLQKNQEHKVNIPNDVKEDEGANSVTVDLCLPVQTSGNNAEKHEESKAKDGSREAESSSNGPTNPILTEIA
uniref:receptor-type tyrosine-protein phosphatase C isoform X2 n=1 Tax=Podarcis muralis TaxID=64176 RepID=UPI0010A031BC|nr:receptor-type tyrosine-protein phosphatase C isoform X2 [Podarcis muralis]